MPKQSILIEFHTYNHISELVYDDQELINYAYSSAERAYAPYSKFYVGAAIRIHNNKQIIVGNNQENASYPCGICAERNAIHYCKANYSSELIETIAITTINQLKDHKPATPCGLCRQVLFETETINKADIKLILGHPKGKIWVFDRCKDLIPLAFKF